MTTTALRALFLFGSRARGDHDALSDIDVLAVVRNKGGRVPSETVLDHLTPLGLAAAPTVSWYGFNRLKSMYEAGELFAWHIFLEGKQLFGDLSVRAELGCPAPYDQAIEDITAFRATLGTVPAQLRSTPHNAIYEFGIMYVCVRNVAMAASWHLCAAPDFSRLSPFRLGGGVLACPLSHTQYEYSMRCRIASQRGLEWPDDISTDMVLSYYELVDSWLCKVQVAVEADSKHA